MKILWLSPCAPYDTIAHAGGQNHNYYLKYLKKNTDFDITLLTVCSRQEKEKLDLDRYEIDNIVKVYDDTKIIAKFQVIWGKIYIVRDGGLFNNAKYHLLMKALKEYHEQKEYPDVVITQWTDATELINTLKMYFPNSKYVAIEEDVAFLGYQRKYIASHGIYRIYRKLKYIYLKKMEISMLKKCDIVVTLNDKDKKLLLDEGLDERIMFRCCSYHKLFKNGTYSPNIYQLLFYGAMSRSENYKSVIWFIEKVMPLLDERYRLMVVGSDPVKMLQKYESERIHFTGFVESVQPYFETSLCLVSPLVLGAGTKIKVLEALSAGTPVITNSVGAEGIGLIDGYNYLHAEVPAEYVNAINKLNSNMDLRMRLSVNGREHINKKFDVDSALNMLIDRIIAL